MGGAAGGELLVVEGGWEGFGRSGYTLPIVCDILGTMFFFLLVVSLEHREDGRGGEA